MISFLSFSLHFLFLLMHICLSIYCVQESSGALNHFYIEKYSDLVKMGIN